MMAVLEPCRFSVLDVENLRLHYAKTLEHWLARFEAQEEQVRAMFDERFVRMWRLYLSGSIAAFRCGYPRALPGALQPQGRQRHPLDAVGVVPPLTAMERCDVLIVGGGPAGSSCAWALRGSGLDVAVMDRSTFPRDKVCAGWITPPLVDALQVDLADYALGRTLQPITPSVRVCSVAAPSTPGSAGR